MNVDSEIQSLDGMIVTHRMALAETSAQIRQLMEREAALRASLGALEAAQANDEKRAKLSAHERAMKEVAVRNTGYADESASA